MDFRHIKISLYYKWQKNLLKKWNVLAQITEKSDSCSSDIARFRSQSFETDLSFSPSILALPSAVLILYTVFTSTSATQRQLPPAQSPFPKSDGKIKPVVQLIKKQSSNSWLRSPLKQSLWIRKCDILVKNLHRIFHSWNWSGIAIRVCGRCWHAVEHWGHF